MLFNDAIKYGASDLWVKTGTFDAKNGTATTEGYTSIYIGNNIPTGTTGNSTGLIRLFSEHGKYSSLASLATGNRYINFPDAGGTLPLIHSESSRQILYLSSDNSWSDMFKFGMGNSAMDLYVYSTSGDRSHVVFDYGTKKITVETPNGTFYVQGQ